MPVVADGAQAAVVGTEHTLATVTDDRVLALAVDCAAMADGDTVRLRLYDRARSTDPERVAYDVTFSHAQSAPLKVSPGHVSTHSFRATLTQVAGVARSFPWSVRRPA